MKSPSKDGLPIWVVYDHPSDYPDTYVARMFNLDKPTDDLLIDADLEKIRDALEGMGLVKLMPMPGDDPVIIETWV